MATVDTFGPVVNVSVGIEGFPDIPFQFISEDVKVSAGQLKIKHDPVLGGGEIEILEPRDPLTLGFTVRPTGFSSFPYPRSFTQIAYNGFEDLIPGDTTNYLVAEAGTINLSLESSTSKYKDTSLKVAGSFTLTGNVIINMTNWSTRNCTEGFLYFWIYPNATFLTKITANSFKVVLGSPRATEATYYSFGSGLVGDHWNFVAIDLSNHADKGNYSAGPVDLTAVESVDFMFTTTAATNGTDYFLLSNLGFAGGVDMPIDRHITRRSRISLGFTNEPGIIFTGSSTVSTNTITIAAPPGVVDDSLNGKFIILRSGAYSGKLIEITDTTVSGGNAILTCAGVDVSKYLSNNGAFEIINSGHGALGRTGTYHSVRYTYDRGVIRSSPNTFIDKQLTEEVELECPHYDEFGTRQFHFYQSVNGPGLAEISSNGTV